MQSNLRLQLILHIIVFVWGFTGILGKEITVGQNVLVWYRMLITFGALGIFMALSGKKFVLLGKDILKLFGIGIIIALHWIFFYGAIKIANVSVSVACMAIASFFTALLQPLLSKTKIIKYELLLGIGVIIGVAVLMGVETDHTIGFIWGILSAFFAALFTVLNAKMVKTLDSTVISFYEMIGGFLGISIYNLFSGDLTVEMISLESNDILNLMILSIICTAIPFVVSVWIMKQLSPYTISISVNMEPVYTIILAVILYPGEEKMHAGFYIGTLIILLTVFTNAYLKWRMRSKSEVNIH
jgi:drug/metabolite transporter (DMT)-like permease